MQILDNQKLYDSLKEFQLIPDKSLNSAFEESKKSNTPLANILADKELISDKDLGPIVADIANLPYINLAKVTIPKDVISLIPLLVAKKQKAIAVSRDKNGIKVAMANANNNEFIEFLTKKTGQKINLVYATGRDIEGAFKYYESGLQKTFDSLLKEKVDEARKAGAGEAPISKIVDLLIEYANDNKASDIHIEPTEKNSLVRFRVDGILHDVLSLPQNLHDQIITRIKILAKLRTDEHLSAQDGKMQLKLESENLDIRVSIVPITDGEKAVLRLLAEHSRQFALNELGISQENIQKITSGFNKPYGMLLATGPTGSGKTTTIYAILKIINSREKNIATIEDPVEYDIESINQIQVNDKTKLTFANGLRSIVRQDPDIIFVGEVRDKETAGIAVNSAMTGHLVLSTLHTNDASTTLPRLIDMAVEPFLIASTVNVIIAQRLIRKICEKCRVSKKTSITEFQKYIPKDILKKHFASPTAKTQPTEITTYSGKGCDVCHKTGYEGRVGLFEVLEITSAIKSLITAKADASQIRAKAITEGMSTMLDDGIEKVKSATTTLEEVLRATKS